MSKNLLLAALLLTGCAKKAEPEVAPEPEAPTGPALTVSIDRANWEGDRGADARGKLLMTVTIANNRDAEVSYESFRAVVHGGDDKACSAEVPAGKVGAGKEKEVSAEATCPFGPLNGKAKVMGKVSWTVDGETGDKKWSSEVSF